jgi:hypothetical protein
MERALFDRYLEPPPCVTPADEALPHLGGLELAIYHGALPDEIEPHVASPLDDAFDDVTAQEMLKCALSQPKVCDRLANARVIPIGASRRGETAKGERRSYLAVAYDYSANVAVEITLDEQGHLLGFRDARYQPLPVQTEVDHAIELARRDERLAGKVVGLAAATIPIAGPNNEFADRRVLEVVFGCRSRRLPKYRAWVDLVTNCVRSIGEVDECCNGHGEGQP